jgi:acyl carrier protein
VNIEEFVAVVRDEIGLPVTVDDAGRPLDDLPGWDSVHLLSLLTAIERRTGRGVSLPDVLEARSLEGVYAVVVAA